MPFCEVIDKDVRGRSFLTKGLIKTLLSRLESVVHLAAFFSTILKRFIAIVCFWCHKLKN